MYLPYPSTHRSNPHLAHLVETSGLGLLLFQLFLYPPVERTLGPVMISRIGAVRLLPEYELDSMSFGYLFFSYILTLHSILFLLKVLSILLLTGYPFIAELTGVGLTLLINFASISKNLLCVSARSRAIPKA